MKRYVIGDLHGNHKGFMQVLEKVNFDYENDLLISLGDWVDGYPDVFDIMETLVSIKNKICIRGNHDQVFLEWLETGRHGFGWLHGGEEVIRSYAKASDREIVLRVEQGGWFTNLTYLDIPVNHRELFKSSEHYHILDDMLFVHGGFNRHKELESQEEEIFLWDRDLWLAAMAYERSNKMYPFKMKTPFNKVFIGHTPTINWKTNNPLFAANIVNVDSGGGYKEGKVTLMNIDSLEYVQSDEGKILYPNHNGR